MYVGPWQEYKLMRVINDVKSENEKLKSLMRSSNNNSIASTPRTLSSTTSGPTSRSTRGPKHALSGLDRLRPRPLDPSAVASTPTPSERSAQSAPILSSSDYAHDVPLQTRYGGHPLYHELARGAPLSSGEREAQAGQPGLKKKAPTGPVRGEELEERLLRRASMSLLYSGGVDERQEPPTRAAKQPKILPSRRPASGALKGNAGGARSGAGASSRRYAQQPEQEALRGRHEGDNTLLNRNVVRDLASFYDAHINDRRLAPQVQTDHVPWETPSFDAPLPPPSIQRPLSDHKNTVPPPPPLPSDFTLSVGQKPNVVRQTHLEPRDGPSVGVGGATNAHPGGMLLGSGDALDLHMQRRPYDIGPRPSAESVYPAVARGPRHSPSSTTTSSTAGLNSTMDTFVMSQDEDRLHQQAADVLRSSTERRQVLPMYRPDGAAALSSRYAPPPPPVLPRDFMGGGNVPQQQRLSVDGLDAGTEWQPSPKKPSSVHRRGASPAHRPTSTATDLSVDGEDVGALLQWASALDHGAGMW